MSLFAWLIGKVTGSTDVSKSNVIMWVAITASTLLFGLGHLPATPAITPLTSFVVVRASLLNGMGGLVFGWLFWKKGLVYGMSAHFTADVVLHALLPLLLT